MENGTQQVAIVTGGGRGIGRAIALRLGQSGAFTVVNYQRNAGAAEEVVRAIEGQGGRGVAVRGDVSSLDGVREFFEQTDEVLGAQLGSTAIDVLVNNAGTGRAGGVVDTEVGDFDAVFDTNVKGTFFVTTEALRRMRDGGRVINVSSGRSVRPFVPTAAYSMAKAAVNAHTILVASEMGHRGITANTLAPGWVETELSAGFLGDDENRREIEAATALGRLGQPDDVASIAAFLASRESQWVTGQYIEASGGFDLTPAR